MYRAGKEVRIDKSDSRACQAVRLDKCEQGIFRHPERRREIRQQVDCPPPLPQVAHCKFPRDERMLENSVLCQQQR